MKLACFQKTCHGVVKKADTIAASGTKVSVFFTTARNKVVKIAHSSSEVVLQSTDTMIYPGSGPS
jgi:peroxiredoxin family protein